MRYMKIGTLILAGVLMLSSMILNSGCSEAVMAENRLRKIPERFSGEVKSAAGAKMLTPLRSEEIKKLRDICFLN